MDTVAAQNSKTAWPILDEEQWHELLSTAITKELVKAGFEQEFSEEEAENFLCAFTVAHPDTHRLSASMLYNVVQEITRQTKTVEDCTRHATLYAECYVKANHALLLRRL
jgi:hypothetical protein